MLILQLSIWINPVHKFVLQISCLKLVLGILFQLKGEVSGTLYLVYVHSYLLVLKKYFT